MFSPGSGLKVADTVVVLALSTVVSPASPVQLTDSLQPAMRVSETVRSAAGNVEIVSTSPWLSPYGELLTQPSPVTAHVLFGSVADSTCLTNSIVASSRFRNVQTMCSPGSGLKVADTVVVLALST